MELSGTSGYGSFLYFEKSTLITMSHLELEAYSELWYIKNQSHNQYTVKHLP